LTSNLSSSSLNEYEEFEHCILQIRNRTGFCEVPSIGIDSMILLTYEYDHFVVLKAKAPNSRNFQNKIWGKRV